MSQVVHALTKLTGPKYYSQLGYFRYLCVNSKDVTKQSAVLGTDLLMQNLKHAQSPKVVLNMVSQHYTIMNNKHIMQALRSLFALQKFGSSDISTSEMLRHPNFERLCRSLKHHSGTIDIHETIEALKVVSYVGVPSDSTIVRVLLQLIRHNINDLNLHHVMFLEYVLGQLQRTPVIEALLIALPLVFEINLQKKMDRENLSHLTEYLFYASRHNLSEKSVQNIAYAILALQVNMDGKNAKSIVWSVTDLPPYNWIEPLLKKALDSLIVNMDDIEFVELETTLTKLLNKYTRRMPLYYHEVFFDSCANSVIDNDLGFHNASFVVRKFSRAYHHNIYLLDYMSKLCKENPDNILKGDIADIYSLVMAIAMTDYRPVYWEHLQKLLNTAHIEDTINKKEVLWLKFISSLCSINVFKENLIEKYINEEHLRVQFSKKFSSDYDQYLTICHSIKLYRPDLSHLLPQIYSPEVVIKMKRSASDFPLEKSLHVALGGENYVKTNLFSKVGAKIDHAIVFRQGGFPIALGQDEVEFIEDISISSDNQLVLVIALNPTHFTLNNGRLKESMRLAMKCLEEDGHTIVPINVMTWESLADFERIPYLMQEINTKLNTKVSLSHNELDNFHVYMDAQESSIKFTLEKEKNNTLSFLDVLITKKSSSLETSVFRKATHTNRYLKYNSNHELNIKRGIVKCLFDRAKMICSNDEIFKQEKEFIKNVLLDNQYPNDFINETFNKLENKNESLNNRQALNNLPQQNPIVQVLNNLPQHTPTVQTLNNLPQQTPIVQTNFKYTTTIPYIKGLSEKIRRIGKIFDVRTVFKTEYTPRSTLTKTKPVNTEQASKNSIYNIPCSCRQMYIGESCRPLEFRLKEHKSAVRNLLTDKSKLAEHVYNNDHVVLWNDTKIIAHEEHTTKRKLKESYFIKKYGTDCISTESVDLNNIWMTLI